MHGVLQGLLAIQSSLAFFKAVVRNLHGVEELCKDSLPFCPTVSKKIKAVARNLQGVLCGVTQGLFADRSIVVFFEAAAGNLHGICHDFCKACLENR